MQTKDTNPGSDWGELEEPFTENGRYSYADHLTWQVDVTVELIKGNVFKTAAALKRRHQEISLEVTVKLSNLLKGKMHEAHFGAR